MKKFFSLTLAALMLMSLLAGCGGGTDTPPADEGTQQEGGEAQTGGKLVVYSALNEDNTIAIAQQFKEDTGIEIEYISLGGGDAVARVQAEMNNPQADFLVGGSVDLYGSLAEAGAFVEYDSPNNDDLDERFNDPNHLWQGWYMGVLSIIINEERFQEELASQGLAEPTTWDDLLRRVEHAHDYRPGVRHDEDSAGALEHPLEEHGGFYLVEVVAVGDDLYKLQGHHNGENYARNGQDNVLGKRLYHAENVRVPALRCLAYLTGNTRHIFVDVVKEAGEVRDNAAG